MSSTNKFSTGLNNWTDNDKPERSDFVSDNSILSNDVMWKEDYDQNGDIAEVGIADYVQDCVESRMNAVGNNYAPKALTKNITLTALGWSNNVPYTQTVQVNDLSTNTIGLLALSQTATQAQREAAREAMITATAQGTNSLTLTADGDQPSIDIPLTVTIIG